MRIIKCWRCKKDFNTNYQTNNDPRPCKKCRKEIHNIMDDKPIKPCKKLLYNGKETEEEAWYPPYGFDDGLIIKFYRK